MDLLLDHGADVRARDGYQRTPLRLAADAGHDAIFQRLLDAGATDSGSLRDALHSVVADARVEMVRTLLDLGADPNATDLLGRGGNTALHVLAGSRERGKSADEAAQLFRLLLERGADVNALNAERDTPLSLAQERGSVALAQLIEDAGGRVPGPGDRYTSLADAADEGSAEGVRFYLEAGADPNALSDDGRNALGRTNMFGPEAALIVRLLLDAGADPNVCEYPEEPAEYNACPLQRAAEASNLEVARILLHAGADPAVVNAEGGALHHLLWGYGRDTTVELARVLIDAGADLGAVNANEDTPLHALLRWDGPPDMAASLFRVLLESGAALDARNAEGATPLHLAAAEGDVTTLTLLLTRGAPTEAENTDGETPLEVARRTGQDAAARVLQRFDARN